MVDPDQSAEDAGLITRPVVTVDGRATLAEAKAIMRSRGVSSLAIVAGTSSQPNRLVGILTQRDIRFAANPNQPVAELMTSDRLITVRNDTTVSQATRLIHQFRIEKLLVVDDVYNIVGIIANSNIERLNGAAELERQIIQSGSDAPIFVPINDRISHRQKPDIEYVVSERASIVRTRCLELLDICTVRVNEQPEITRAAQEYLLSLDAVLAREGAYRLFVAGLQLEAISEVKSSLPIDDDRNPAIGADLVLAIRLLIIAHAGLVAALPDLSSLSREFSIYQDQLSALRKIAEVRPFQPILQLLSKTDDLLDSQTLSTTKSIASLSVEDKIDASPNRGAIAIEQAWLRGSLATIGSVLVSQWKYVSGKLKDTITTEAIKGAMYNPGTLASAAYIFFTSAKPYLIELANTLPTIFGWLHSIIKLIHL